MYILMFEGMMAHHGIVSKKMYSRYHLLVSYFSFPPAIQFSKVAVMFMSFQRFLPKLITI